MNGPDTDRSEDEAGAFRRGAMVDARAEGDRIAAWVRQNRALLEILAIGAVALSGIVCMVLVTLLIVWRQANP